MNNTIYNNYEFTSLVNGIICYFLISMIKDRIKFNLIANSRNNILINNLFFSKVY
ncbi:hypothetical protein GCM10027085_01450 [Spirosoma aerophilum]